MAREGGLAECVKLLEQAPYLPLDKVMFSLHCAGVVGGVSRESGMTPLSEFCTDERYSHMMESMMGMVMKVDM